MCAFSRPFEVNALPHCVAQHGGGSQRRGSAPGPVPYVAKGHAASSQGGVGDAGHSHLRVYALESFLPVNIFDVPGHR